MTCQFHQFVDIDFTDILRVRIGMNPDGRVDVVVLFRQRQRGRKVRKADGHTQGMADLVFGHVAQYFVLAFGQFPQMDVAM